MDRVDQAAVLAVALAGLGPAEQITVQVQLVEFSGSVAAVQILRRARRGADRPRRGNVGEDLGRVQIVIENLNSTVAAIGNVDVAFGVSRDAMRGVELV